MCWITIGITAACKTISENYFPFTLGALIRPFGFHLGLDESNLLHHSEQIDLATLEHLIGRAHKVVALMGRVFRTTFTTQEKTMRAGGETLVF
jgi:hypothetical protein